MSIFIVPRGLLPGTFKVAKSYHLGSYGVSMRYPKDIF